MLGKIAFVTTSFSTLSHTFIRREIAELRRLGVDIYLFGVRPEKKEQILEKGITYDKETVYLYPIKIFPVIRSNIWFAISKPFCYLKTFYHSLLNKDGSIWQRVKSAYHFFISPYIAAQMQEKGISHIHAHFLHVPSTIAMYCSKLLDVSFSITAHSAGIAKLKEMSDLKTKVKEAKFIFAVSNYTKDYIDKFIYPCSKKTYVVRCGLNPREYSFKDSHRFGGGIDGKIQLVAIGRLVEKKGFSYLIEGTSCLRKAHVNFNVKIIGAGPLKLDLEILSKMHGLASMIVFTGQLPTEETKQELNKSDIIIVPSVESKSGEKEGLPIVIIEAMALGVLVLATEHSGIPEVVKHKVTGLLVPERDSGAICESIKLALRNKKLREECIQNARRLILEEFDIAQTAKLKMDIFKKNI